MNYEKQWERLMIFGAKLGCHQMAERSFFFHGYQFPVCARCTGLLFGYVIALLTWGIIEIPFTLSILICVPLVIDGITQYIHLRTSNQTVRFVTGFLCGIGITRLEVSLILALIHDVGGKM